MNEKVFKIYVGDYFLEDGTAKLYKIVALENFLVHPSEAEEFPKTIVYENIVTRAQHKKTLQEFKKEFTLYYSDYKD